MKRVVLDTNILAAAFRSRLGASFIILQHVASRRLVPLVTTALFIEYEAVLKRPEQNVVHHLSPEQVDIVMNELAALSEAVEIHFRWRPQLSDPKDELVLEAAVNGRADALITFNIRDFQPAAKRFGLHVMPPGTFLKEMKI